MISFGHEGERVDLRPSAPSGWARPKSLQRLRDKPDDICYVAGCEKRVLRILVASGADWLGAESKAAGRNDVCCGPALRVLTYIRRQRPQTHKRSFSAGVARW